MKLKFLNTKIFEKTLIVLLIVFFLLYLLSKPIYVGDTDETVIKFIFYSKAFDLIVLSFFIFAFIVNLIFYIKGEY